MRFLGYIFICVFSFSIFSCVVDEPDNELVPMIPVPEPEKQTVFGVFEANETTNEILIEGIITESTAGDLSALLIEYPDTRIILMGNVEGATTNEAAFEAARVVRSNEIDIHVVDNSIIIREAVDFMLGGLNRSKGENTQLGVGAWINDQGEMATDFPFGHEAHLPWINFYQEMGFQFQQATDFYNFYIFAATSDETLFLTDNQINTFGLLD